MEARIATEAEIASDRIHAWHDHADPALLPRHVEPQKRQAGAEERLLQPAPEAWRLPSSSRWPRSQAPMIDAAGAAYEIPVRGKLFHTPGSNVSLMSPLPAPLLARS